MSAEEVSAVGLDDGRRISYRTYGAPGGIPVLALHGTPASSLKFAGADAAARDAGLSLVAPDRWGYGETPRHPRPSLAAFADDMAALADRLAIPRFHVFGISGGGPYAAAVASRLPGRVLSLALAAPVGPVTDLSPGAMGPLHRFCFGPLGRSERAVEIIFRSFRFFLGAAPDLAWKLASIRSAPADRRLLRDPDIGPRLARASLDGLKLGAAGPATDLDLFSRPWEIPLDAVSCPARLWLGTEDRNVPIAAARELARRLPACQLVELAGEGHFWVGRNYAEVCRWLAAASETKARSP